MSDVKIPEWLTIESALVLLVGAYLLLQFMGPVFIIFQFVADILLYLVAIAVGGFGIFILGTILYAILEMVKEQTIKYWAIGKTMKESNTLIRMILWYRLRYKAKNAKPEWSLSLESINKYRDNSEFEWINKGELEE